MQNNILICGVGGQGIVLTSKLIAATAMAKDIPVMSAETIGMAQKGGSVVNTHPIMPVTASLKGSSYNGSEMLDYLAQKVGDLKTVDGESACVTVGSPRALNMVMLGQAVRTGVLPFGIDDVEDTMKKTVKPQFIEMNSKALRLEI